MTWAPSDQDEGFVLILTLVSPPYEERENNDAFDSLNLGLGTPHVSIQSIDLQQLWASIVGWWNQRLLVHTL